MNCSRSILLLVALSVGAATTVEASITTIADPLGDTFGIGPYSLQEDIEQMTAEVTGSDLIFTVNFSDTIISARAMAPGPGPIPPDILMGFIDLDVDRNPLTGAPSNVSLFGNSPSGLGIEYFVELKSERLHPGFVDIFDATTLSLVHTVPILFAPTPLPTSFSLSIPLAAIGSNDGQVNFGALMGTIPEWTDQVLGSTGAVPEPGSLAVWGLLSAIGLLVLTRRHTRS